MMIKITCPTCQVEGSISLLEANYKGPYRCWKCRALYNIVLTDNKLTSWEPLTEDELVKQQEMEILKKKMQR